MKPGYKYTPEQVAGHRAAWYAYLRENPEKQGRGALHEILLDGTEWYAYLRKNPEKRGCGILHQILLDGTEKLCCLGAGCVVLVERGVPMVAEREEEIVRYDGEETLVTYKKAFVRYDGRFDLPPAAFVEAMELLSNNPLISIGGEDKSAAAWNDNGAPWLAIADGLEATFPADAEVIRRAREAA